MSEDHGSDCERCMCACPGCVHVPVSMCVCGVSASTCVWCVLYVVCICV